MQKKQLLFYLELYDEFNCIDSPHPVQCHVCILARWQITFNHYQHMLLSSMVSGNLELSVLELNT